MGVVKVMGMEMDMVRAGHVESIIMEVIHREGKSEEGRRGKRK